MWFNFSGGRGRRDRPRFGDYIEKHAAGEGYPEVSSFFCAERLEKSASH